MNYVCFKSLLLTFFTLILTSFPSYAQQVNELYIVDEKIEIATGEIIRNSETNMDNNGRLAAGLLIYTDLPNLSFESNNGIIKSSNNTGSWLLYLSPNERVVTVYGSEFVPKQIILSEYGVNLKSGKVWKLTITGNKKADQIPIVLRTNPPDADIFVNGKKTDFSTSQLLTPGEYKIEILEEGYEPFSETITVNQQNTFFELDLVKLEPQRIDILTDPAGSIVKIDGIEEGETDSEGKLSMFKYPGEYSVEVNLSGYLSEEKMIEVLNKDVNSFDFALQKNSGSVQFNIDPDDAQLMINKREYAANEDIDLAPGLYLIDVLKDGYKPEEFEVRLERGDAIVEEIKLEPYIGTVFFTVSPSYAEVKLYDERNNLVESWEGTKRLGNILYGNYTYKVEANSYKPLEGSLKVNSESVSINESLSESAEVSSSPPQVNTQISSSPSQGGVKLQIVGTPARSPGDIVSDRDDNKDIDGNLYAVLQINTELKGLTFRSNYGIGKVQELPTRYYLLYLSEDEQRVTVFKDGFPPLEINLSEEGIELESGMFWIMNLTD